MKAELRFRKHSILPDKNIFEVWYDGKFIAEVVGADGPGVRLLSKHPVEKMNNDALVTTVLVDPSKVLAWLG
jgi:hypothetical protein